MQSDAGRGGGVIISDGNSGGDGDAGDGGSGWLEFVEGYPNRQHGFVVVITCGRGCQGDGMRH